MSRKRCVFLVPKVRRLTVAEQMLCLYPASDRPPLKLLCASLWIDALWSAELVRVYGRDGCQARYEARGRGEAGSLLREIYDLRVAITAEQDAERASCRLSA